jgi:hypothetical protein
MRDRLGGRLWVGVVVAALIVVTLVRMLAARRERRTAIADS